MKEKLKMFAILMIHFVGVLSMGIEFGEALERKSMTFGTWLTLFVMLIWIGCYVYLSIKTDTKVESEE